MMKTLLPHASAATRQADVDQSDREYIAQQQRSASNMSSKESRRSIQNGARQSSHARPAKEREAVAKTRAAAMARKVESIRQEQLDSGRKPGSSPYDLNVEPRPGSEPKPSQAEVDAAFEAVTGHKRPAHFDPTTEHLENEEERRLEAEWESLKSAEESVKKVVDSPLVDEVVSPQTAIMPQSSKDRTVNLTLKNLSKNGKQAIYSGGPTSIRFAVAAFEGGQAPQTLELNGPFVGPKEPKPQMTAEERKAARAAKPKPTLAERAAKAQARAQRLAELAAAEGNQPSA